MDSQLRLLLRKYSITQDPEDAMIFANAALRANEIVPTQTKIYGLKVSHDPEEHGWTEYYSLSALVSFNHLITWLESQTHYYTHYPDYRAMVVELRNQWLSIPNQNLSDFHIGSILARIVSQLNQMQHHYHIRMHRHWRFEFSDLVLDV